MRMATEPASVMNSGISDLAVCVEAGTLVVQAQRTGHASQSHQSEFRYGRFARHATLPGELMSAMSRLLAATGS